MLCRNKEISQVLGISNTSSSRTYTNQDNNKSMAVDMGVYCIKNDMSKEDVKMAVDMYVRIKEHIKSKI